MGTTDQTTKTPATNTNNGVDPKQDHITKSMLFAKYYVWNNLNATRAAKLAGYSKRSASEIGYELLRKPQVKAEIARLIAIREKNLQVTDERIIEELAMSAFSDPRDYYDDDGNLLPIQKLSENAAKALAEFTVTQGRNGNDTVVKIKQNSKQAALDTLARIKNMFYVDQDPNIGMKERIIYYPVKVAEGAPVELDIEIKPPAKKKKGK